MVYLYEKRAGDLSELENLKSPLDEAVKRDIIGLEERGNVVQ